MIISKAVLYLEIDGKLCLIKTDGWNLDLFVDIVSTISPSGKLEAIHLGPDFKLIH